MTRRATSFPEAAESKLRRHAWPHRHRPRPRRRGEKTNPAAALEPVPVIFARVLTPELVSRAELIVDASGPLSVPQLADRLDVDLDLAAEIVGLEAFALYPRPWRPRLYTLARRFAS